MVWEGFSIDLASLPYINPKLRSESLAKVGLNSWRVRREHDIVQRQIRWVKKQPSPDDSITSIYKNEGECDMTYTQRDKLIQPEGLGGYEFLT